MINLIFSTMLLGSSIESDGIKIADREIENTHGGWISGSRHLDEIDLAFQVGAYDQFLQSVDQQYIGEKAEGGRLEEFIRQLEGYDEDVLSDQKAAQEEGEESFNDQILKLSLARNLKLLDIAAQFPEHEVSQAIKTVHESAQLIEDYEESIGYIFGMEYLCWRTENPLERKAADICQECMVKKLLVDDACRQCKIDADTARAQKIVLQKDKMRKIAALCEKEGCEDCEITQKLKRACEIFPTWVAHTLDLSYLKDLGLGKIDPRNDVEKQVQKIIAEHKEQVSALIEKHCKKC